MKYLKLFEDYKDIDAICQKYAITNYTINSDGSIDVDEDVHLRALHELPLKFNRVSGRFDCAYNNLTSLEGAPEIVGGNFNCRYNQLTTLEGAPKEVGGSFYCADNQLISLWGAPKWVGHDFSCSFNKLTSLEGAPREVGGNFYCAYNQLTTLEGAPIRVGGYFGFAYNPLPKLIKSNEEYLKEIIKWQDEYNIWRGGKLDQFRFGEMMIDIKNEVGS